MAAATRSPPAAPRTAARSTSRSARTATLLHRQAEDPGHRWPGRALRGAVRQAQPLALRRRPLGTPAGGRRLLSGAIPTSGSAPTEPAKGLAMTARRAAEAASRAAAHPCQDLIAEYARAAGAAGRSRGARRPGAARRLGRRYAELTPIVTSSADLDAARGDLAGRARTGRRGPRLRRRGRGSREPGSPSWRTGWRELLTPRDPTTQGRASSRSRRARAARSPRCSPATCLRMYLRYAERRGWKTEVLSATESDLGGYKDATSPSRRPARRPRRTACGPG